MAETETTGLVQNIKVNYSDATTYVFIGPSPTDTDTFLVRFSKPHLFGDPDREAVFLGVMVDLLVSAMVTGRQVVVRHDEDRADITMATLWT